MNFKDKITDMASMQANNFSYLEISSQINKNVEFLLWLNNKVRAHYLPLLNVVEMQELVEKVVAWYERKYPNRNSIITEDGTYTFTANHNASEMSVEALKNDIPGLARCLMDCDYRMGRSTNFDEGTLSVCIEDQYGMPHFLEATKREGLLKGNLGVFAAVPKSIGKEELSLDDLYDVLADCPKYDLKELERVITAHECDVLIRNVLLQTITLAIKNSNTSLPRVAEARAAKWIEEITGYYEDHPELCNSNIDFVAIANPQAGKTKSGSTAKSFVAKHLYRRIDSRIIANCRSKQ